MHRHLLILIICLLNLTVISSTAWAQDDTEAKLEALNAKALERYKAQDYEAAIELFKQAYEIDPIPNLLYNIAKCHEKLKNWDEAIKYYNEFVVSPDVDAKVRKETLEYIEGLRKVQELEKQQNDPKKDPDPIKKPVEPKPDEGPDRTGAYISLGAGAALIGTGVAFGLLASGQQSTFESATTSQARKDARSTGTTYALVADVGYGLGVAAIGIGAYLWLTADDKSDTPQPTNADQGASTLSPWFSPSGGGLLWQTRF